MGSNLVVSLQLRYGVRDVNRLGDKIIIVKVILREELPFQLQNDWTTVWYFGARILNSSNKFILVDPKSLNFSLLEFWRLKTLILGVEFCIINIRTFLCTFFLQYWFLFTIVRNIFDSLRLNYVECETWIQLVLMKNMYL